MPLGHLLYPGRVTTAAVLSVHRKTDLIRAFGAEKMRHGCAFLSVSSLVLTLHIQVPSDAVEKHFSKLCLAMKSLLSVRSSIALLSKTPPLGPPLGRNLGV